MDKKAGNRLKKLRKKTNLTVRELAELTNISYPTISRLENGLVSFTSEYLLVLTKFFGVTTDYLLGIEKPKLTLIITKKLIEYCKINRLYLEHKDFFNLYVSLSSSDKKVLKDIAKSFLRRYNKKEEGVITESIKL